MTILTVSLLDQIRSKSQKIADGEGNLVLMVIDLARDFVALQQQSKRKWLKELKRIGYHPRIACRYLEIGKSWWCDQSGPIGSDLAQKLPYDVQKLEWLARLEKPDLEELLKDLDPQKEGRSRVIKAVQRRLGVQAEAEQAATISADVLLKKWQKFVHQTLDAIESLGDDAATEERRKQLARQMQTEFLEIQEALDPPAEDEGDPVDDQDDEVEQGTQPSQDVTARPAPAALSAWSRRPR